MDIKDQDIEAFVHLAIKYLNHRFTEDTAEDPDEWKYDSEEKFNALYDSVWEFLEFPSLAQIQQVEAPAKDVMEAIHLFGNCTSKLTWEMLNLVYKLIIQTADLPVEEKAKLLADLSLNKEDIQLSIELKNAKSFFEDMHRMERLGLLD